MRKQHESISVRRQPTSKPIEVARQPLLLPIVSFGAAGETRQVAQPIYINNGYYTVWYAYRDAIEVSYLCSPHGGLISNQSLLHSAANGLHNFNTGRSTHQNILRQLATYEELGHLTSPEGGQPGPSVCSAPINSVCLWKSSECTFCRPFRQRPFRS